MAADFMSIDLSTEKVLLSVPTQREECCHSAGSMEFGPDGLLYIATGDDTNPHASDGYSPSDEREGRMPWDAQKSSANTNDLRGKILRIKPEADGTYSIPEGNLFAEGEANTHPEIYVMGCRNPFRISIDQRTGYLYWGDVGPDAGTDSTGRGPRGYDEVNQAQQAGFYGWPYFIANNLAYHRYDFATRVAGDPHDPEEPVNQSPNNTGLENLPPANPAFIYYPYAASKEFPAVGDGGRNAMAGPVFYVDDYTENEGRYPEYYDGKLFTYDWMRGWIMAVTMEENGAFKRMERFLPSYRFSNPVDMVFSPNGDIFLLEYGTIWFSQNEDARLVHLKYISGNRQPVAQFDADTRVGAAPLTVQFNAEATKDYDGDELTYEWYFEDEGEVNATVPNPAHTFSSPGKYEINLVVKDPEGATSSSKMEILVGNALPELSWQFEGNRTFFWDDQTMGYEVMVKDEEDGNLGNGIDAGQVNVSIDYLAQGYDANEAAMGHAAMQEASAFLLGKKLMEQSDCSTCHQMEQQSVGPSYLEVAKKYEKDADAIGYLAGKIINGGGGIWGETVMAAHPQLSESEAGQMAKYILSLAGSREDLVAGLSHKGSYTFDQQQPGNFQGKYILTASYTDRGGEKIGPLTAREVITLRYPMIMAHESDEVVKAMRFTITPEMSQGMLTEDLDVLICENNAQLVFKDIDLTGIGAIKLNLLKAGQYFSGGSISIHLDAPNGKPIGSAEIKTNMVDFGADEQTIPIRSVEGLHDIYYVLKNDGSKPITAVVSMEYQQKQIN